MPTVLEFSTEMYRLALKMPDARSKRYYLARGQELAAHHDHLGAMVKLRNLVLDAKVRLEKAGTQVPK